MRDQGNTAMKAFVLAAVFFGVASVLLWPPPAANASPPPADSVRICAFDDYERWRRDHPRPAAKPLADLNVGEPRTVRMIYFLPNDWPYRADVVDSMKTVIKQSQTFYREQMQAHGYGDWTFRIETDAQGGPLVHRVDGQHPFSHYDNTLGTAVVAELEQTFDLDASIYFIVLGTDALRQGDGNPAGGVGRRRTKNGGELVVPDDFGFFTVTHELGHTFGLYHDFRDNRYIMSYGFDQRGVLSACAAEFLAVHTYFNPAIPIAEGTPPTVEITSPTRYQPGTTSVPVQFQVSDSEGLHQVMLVGNADPCRGLSKKEAVVEFNYDGSFWEGGFTNLSDQNRHHILIVAVDAEGNVSETSSFLVEISPYEIATLRAHSEQINSVAFSPDGAILASGSGSYDSEDPTVRLWDVAAQTEVATLTGHSDGVWAVAFSPDGTLASVSRRDGIKLWDVATRKEIATLEGQPPMAFSRDGTLLASGTPWWKDRTIALWDARTLEKIATFAGHTSQINVLAFSPDGTLLASGSGEDDSRDSEDLTVRLWDVAAQTEVATLTGHSDGVWAVAFSSNGAILASGGGWNDSTVKLWDAESRELLCILEGHNNGVYSVAFSLGGGILASGGNDRTIKLWDMVSCENIATFVGHVGGIPSLAFSPTEATLASASRDGTIKLWDISEWMRPRPSALEIISGDGQQGAPGAALTQPLVVEVRDQNGDLLPEASVTFTVTGGEGQLSGRFTVEHATTDADGRAELLLTLGPNPGPNIVGVSFGGRELATFTAQGVGTAVAELEGNYRTWHLPAAATVRLGKGALGQGDRAVALSADGRCLAVASAIGVWLYEASTSRAQALLPSESPVHSVAFSLDGALAAGLDNGRVELWGVETGERIGTLRHGDWGGVTAVFSSDGTKLASGSLEQVIKVWDVETRRVAGTWEVPRDSDSYWDISVAFSPDGTRLVSGFQDGTVRLWDVASQTEVAALEGHTDRVASVAFSPDGALLASVAGSWDDRNVILWNAATQGQVATLRGHTSEVRSVAFSPDGATLASGSWDRTVRLWDVATRTRLATLEGHGGPVYSVTFSRDGAMLVSGAADGTVLLRDVETGNVARLSGHGSLSSMALSPDGATLASGFRDGTVRLWDAATRTPIATFGGHTSGVGSVSFSSDGALLASGSLDRTVKLWEVRTREPVGTLEGHIGRVRSVAFSPDGATLASAGGRDDATVRLWDVGARELIATLEGHTKSVESVAFSPPDGALLASAGGWEEKTVKLWDVATRELIGTLEGHEDRVNAVAFSPDGNILASVSRDGAKLWTVETREPIANLEGAGGLSVSFSPDGQSLVSGSWGTVSLWDVTTKRRTASLEGHTGSIHSVAFAHDGVTLASGAWDGTMLLWDMQLLQPRPHTLTKVSGVEQQVPAGSLAKPYVVLVRDQNGDPLAGATVTFAVTTGGGTLSAETATTDADGRAAATLTLGPQPGTNTVEATVDRLEPGTNTVEATVDRLEPVIFTATGLAVAQSLTKLSGHDQQGPVGTPLGDPLVVSVLDQNGSPYAGAEVTFVVTTGEGTLSVETATTDSSGRAAAALTLGSGPGPITVAVTVGDLDPVIFTAVAEATPDFDGDGVASFADFFLFADAFGTADARFDLDGSGVVDFGDFFIFADAFGEPARAKLLALAAKLIGLPEGPQLQQNAPNPFNSQTVISYFLLASGQARLEVYGLSGQRVAVLQEGPRKAGLHRFRWDGRDDQGRPLASGVYMCRLVTAEGSKTRKFMLLR